MSAHPGETPYVETEALLAIMSQDRETAQRLLSDMLRNELVTFERQVQFLLDLVRTELGRGHP